MISRFYAIISGLKKNSFFRGVTVIASGTVAAQTIAFLLAPILSRLYTPEDFGLLGVYISMVSMLASISALAYEKAVPLPSKDTDSINILALGLIIVFCFSVVLFIVLMFFGLPILAMFNSERLYCFRLLIPIASLGVGTYTVLSYWALRKKTFSTLARTKVVQGSGQAIFQSALGVVGVKPLGLILGDVLGRFLGIFTLIKNIYRYDKELIKHISIKRIKANAIAYKDFPRFTVWANLLHNASGIVPILMFAAFYGQEVTGWLLFGEKVVSVPVSVVGGSIAQVFLSEAAALSRQAPNLLRNLFRKTVKSLFVVGIGPVVVLIIAGPWLFSLLFGSIWREAGIYVCINSIAIFVKFVVGPVFSLINILGKQKWQLICDAVGMVLVVLGICGAYFLGWPARFAVAAYAVAVSIMYLSLLYMSNKALYSIDN